MKDNSLTNIINNIDDTTLENFMEKELSTTRVSIDYEKVEFDYSWLEKAEETIEYLDKIIRNPRRFIIQEEEVVPVERTKKITVETVKHLAQHTDLIQDIDRDGNITPSKLLNIHKEESFDVYENRFIYSLLVNLSMFIKKRKEISGSGSTCKSQKKLEYIGETKIGPEKVKMSLNLETSSFEDLIGKSPEGLSIDERIDRIELIVADFLKSQFIRELTSGMIVPVRSPIRKTNAILKNPNLQKALELWEFIERYDVKDKQEIKDKRDFEDKKDIKEKMDMSFFLDYLILNSAFEGEKKNSLTLKKYYINKIIKDFINNNDDYDENKFKKMLTDEFKTVKKERLTREMGYIKIFKRYIKKYEHNYNNLTKELK